MTFQADLNAFVARWNGKRIRSAGGLGGQCVDLVEQYIAEVFKYRALPGNAVDLYGKNLDEWTWVHNNPADLKQLPPVGAVMVWGADRLIGTGALGHTDVVLAVTAAGFTGFDQNWPVGAVAHRQAHSYEGVIGWGIPHDRMGRSLLVDRAIPAPPVAPFPLPPESRTWTEHQKEYWKLYGHLPPGDPTPTGAAAAPPPEPLPPTPPPVKPAPGPPIDQTRDAWSYLAAFFTESLPAAWAELRRLLGITNSL